MDAGAEATERRLRHRCLPPPRPHTIAEHQHGARRVEEGEMCAHAPGGDWCDRAARGKNGYTICHPPFGVAHACASRFADDWIGAPPMADDASRHP